MESKKDLKVRAVVCLHHRQVVGNIWHGLDNAFVARAEVSAPKI
jgi:hypothetical protein